MADSDLTEKLGRLISSLGTEGKIAIGGLELKVGYMKLVSRMSHNQIAKALDINVGNVSHAWKRFRRKFRDLAIIVDGFRGRKPADPKELMKHVWQRREELAREGYWIYSTVPRGYVKIGKGRKSKLIPDPDPKKVELIKRLFREYRDGKPLGVLGKETGIPPSDIGKILRNPVYVGKIAWRGRIICEKGRHEPLIDEETWMEVQKLLKRSRRLGIAPFGVRNVSGHFEPDPEKAPVVRRIFEMRVHEGRTQKEIAEELGLKRHNVTYILKNKIYKELGIVSPDLFEAANKIGNRIRVRRAMKITEERKFEILSLLLKSKGPLGTTQIAKKLGLTRNRTLILLKSMEGKWIRRHGQMGKEGYSWSLK